jgi:hypothetical protein
MSLVLTLKQVEHIKTLASETGRSQAEIGREIVERGIAARRDEPAVDPDRCGAEDTPPPTIRASLGDA